MTGNLTHSPADIIRRLLIAEGLGTDPSDSGSWPVYAKQQPENPDSLITLFDTVGTLQGRLMGSGEMVTKYGIQVSVRSPDFNSGYTKAKAIANALDTSIKLDTVVIGSNTYTVYAVTRTTDVLPLGKEVPTSKRNLFTINALVSLRDTT